MKDTNPAMLCALIIISTACLLMFVAEVGVIYRSKDGDVEQTRMLITEMMKMLLACAVGILLGRNQKPN